MVSNDGLNFRLPAEETPFLKHGEDGTWDQGGVLQGQGASRNVGDQTFIYYGAWDPHGILGRRAVASASPPCRVIALAISSSKKRARDRATSPVRPVITSEFITAGVATTAGKPHHFHVNADGPDAALENRIARRQGETTAWVRQRRRRRGSREWISDAHRLERKNRKPATCRLASTSGSSSKARATLASASVPLCMCGRILDLDRVPVRGGGVVNHHREFAVSDVRRDPCTAGGLGEALEAASRSMTRRRNSLSASMPVLHGSALGPSFFFPVQLGEHGDFFRGGIKGSFGHKIGGVDSIRGNGPKPPGS